MLTNKQLAVLKLLSETNDYLCIKQIAEQLNLSPRTIKNYLADIKKENDQYISTSFKGVIIKDQKAVNKILNNQQEELDNYLDRAYYVIKKILVDHQKLNLLDLCDELYLSYATLKNDIQKWNIIFSKYNIHFKTKNSLIYIEGSEANKRKLVSKVIFEETNHDFLDIAILYDIFSEEAVKKLSKILKQYFDEHYLYINDFSFINLLLHILILIDRLKCGQSITVNNNEKLKISLSDLEQVKKLCHDLETNFCIQINQNECSEIFMLIRSNTNISFRNNNHHIDHYVGNHLVTITNKIVKNINYLYSIDLQNDTFIVPFCLHLKALSNRIKNNTFNKNPLLINIKNECPIIYEVAISISLILNEIFQTKINESEIAFIAIHVGTELERQKNNAEKINCVLLCPEYLNNQMMIHSKLLYHLGNDINIILTVSNLSEITTNDFDLLITTIDIPMTKHKTFLLPPLNIERTIYDLQQIIKNIQFNRKRQKVLKELPNLFDNNLFYLDPIIENKYEIIKFLCVELEKNKCIQGNFYHKVLEREEISSTEFGKIAIPHALNTTSIITKIPVIISTKGLLWDNNKVHLIVLPTVNSLDQKKFTELYEVIISLFAKIDAQNFAKEINNFTDFYNYIYQTLAK